MYSTTGKFLPPSGKASSFSHENWGDYEIPNGKGGHKLKWRSTLYLKKVDSLKDNHWKSIMDQAAVFMGKRKTPAKQEEVDEVVVDDDEEEEDVLYDPMFEG